MTTTSTTSTTPATTLAWRKCENYACPSPTYGYFDVTRPRCARCAAGPDTTPATPAVEKAARAHLRQYGFQVEAVSYIHRQGDEFAAIVIHREQPDLLTGVETLFANPAMALVITRRHTGRYDTRIYVAFRAPAGPQS